MERPGFAFTAHPITHRHVGPEMPGLPSSQTTDATLQSLNSGAIVIDGVAYVNAMGDWEVSQ